MTTTLTRPVTPDDYAHALTLYKDRSAPPLAVAHALAALKDRGCTYKNITFNTHIPPASIAHYLSLLTLPADLQARIAVHRSNGKETPGTMNLKEARAVASIDGQDRQREIADLFTSGRLSSIHAEAVTVIAKRHPALTADEIAAQVLSLRLRKASPERLPVLRPTRPVMPAPPPDLCADVLRLAGLLDMVRRHSVPADARLRLYAALRRLAKAAEQAGREVQ